LVIAAAAQQPVPASTQARLTTAARLDTLSLSDFTEVVFEAQSAHPEAQYLMALFYEQGRFVPRDFAVARDNQDSQLLCDCLKWNFVTPASTEAGSL
jgi:TPR repeat protein